MNWNDLLDIELGKIPPSESIPRLLAEVRHLNEMETASDEIIENHLATLQSIRSEAERLQGIAERVKDLLEWAIPENLPKSKAKEELEGVYNANQSALGYLEELGALAEEIFKKADKQ